MIFYEANALPGKTLLRKVQISSLKSAAGITGKYFQLYCAEKACKPPGSQLQFNLIRTIPAIFPLELTSVEYHSEDEVFCFVSGISTMVMEDAAGTMSLMKIPGSTVVLVPAGIRHYIGPAVSEEALCLVVASKKAQTFYQII